MYCVMILPTLSLTSSTFVWLQTHAKNLFSLNMEFPPGYVCAKPVINQTWNLGLKACYCMTLEYSKKKTKPNQPKTPPTTQNDNNNKSNCQMKIWLLHVWNSLSEFHSSNSCTSSSRHNPSLPSLQCFEGILGPKPWGIETIAVLCLLESIVT